jgi:hypothetical protein
MVTAEDRERRLLVDKCERLVWRLSVETKFVNAMQAAANGERVDWQVWPPTHPQAVSDQAAAEYGFNPQTLRRDTYEQPPGLEASLDPANRSFYDHLELKLRHEAEPHAIAGYIGLIGIPFGSYSALEEALKRAYEPPMKAILACAADTYERVRAAVEGSVVADQYDVVRNPLLVDGQVIRIDPSVLDLPKPEAVFDRDAFRPQYVCPACHRKRSYAPGYCLGCEEFRKALPPPSTNIMSIITGIEP